MNRRLVLLAVGAVLAATTAAPALAGKPARCATFTDAKGDGGPSADPALDITTATYKSIGKELVATLTVDKLADRPQLAAGNRFQFDFQLAGHKVTLYYKHGPAREQEANAFYQQGLRVDDVFINDGVTGTIKGNDVSIAVPYSALKGELGAVLGKPLSGLTASTLMSYVATNESGDEAVAPAGLSYVAGAACK